MSLWIYWLIIIILLVVIEAMTVNLVAVWFIASGLLALLVSFFFESILLQLMVFVVLGALFMILTKPAIEKMKSEKEIKLNLERILGCTAIVTKEIKKDVVGEVKADGKFWSAISSNKIAVGEEVTVKEIDGVKLVVEKNKVVKKKNSTPKNKNNTSKKKKETTKKKGSEN